MQNNLTKVYDLKDDHGLIHTYQTCTNEGRAGPISEHGLFGSPVWWRAIETVRFRSTP